MKWLLKLKEGDKMGVKYPLSVSKKVNITVIESEWLEKQAADELVSENSLIRRALKLYRETMDE